MDGENVKFKEKNMNRKQISAKLAETIQKGISDSIKAGNAPDYEGFIMLALVDCSASLAAIADAMEIPEQRAVDILLDGILKSD